MLKIQYWIVAFLGILLSLQGLWAGFFEYVGSESDLPVWICPECVSGEEVNRNETLVAAGDFGEDDDDGDEVPVPSLEEADEEDLLGDVLFLVAEFLNHKDLVSFSLVSKQFREVALRELERRQRVLLSKIEVHEDRNYSDRVRLLVVFRYATQEPSLLSLRLLGADLRERVWQIFLGEYRAGGLVYCGDSRMRGLAVEVLGWRLGPEAVFSEEECRLLMEAFVGSDVTRGLIYDEEVPVRVAAAKGLRYLYALIARASLEEQRQRLLCVLLGEDEQGGLICDSNLSVKKAAAWNLVSILKAKTRLPEDERKRCVRAVTDALWGGCGRGGLLLSADHQTVQTCVCIIPALVSSGVLLREELGSFVCMLTGIGGEDGFIDYWHYTGWKAWVWVRLDAADGIVQILKTGLLSAEACKRLKGVLVKTFLGGDGERGLIHDDSVNVCLYVAQRMVTFLEVEVFTQVEEKPWIQALGDVLLRRAGTGFLGDERPGLLFILDHGANRVASEILERVLELRGQVF